MPRKNLTQHIDHMVILVVDDVWHMQIVQTNASTSRA